MSRQWRPFIRGRMPFIYGRMPFIHGRMPFIGGRGRCIRRLYACGGRFAELPANLGVREQSGKAPRGVRCMNEGIVAGGGPRLRLERQSIPDGRIAGNQVAAFAAQEPRSRLPSIAGLAARNGQYVAYGLVQALFENLRQTRALHRILEPRIERINIRLQAALAPQAVEGIFVGWKYVLRVQPQFLGDAHEKAPRRVRGHRILGFQ